MTTHWSFVLIICVPYLASCSLVQLEEPSQVRKPDYTQISMKMTATRRALLLANLFNLLVAIYFIIISIVSLIQLRWYHQLTVTLKVRHVITTTTSYLAFLILLLAALILIAIFLIGLINSRPRVYTGPGGQDAIEQVSTQLEQPARQHNNNNNETFAKQRLDGGSTRFFIKDSSSRSQSIGSNHPRACWSILLHLISAINLLLIMLIWLLNTGELVRDSISSQLDQAFAKYQFANRSNHYSVAIDGMQDINNCCGSLDYTDFPHQRISGLSSGHYPGSCCGKNIFGVNARVHCVPEEIVRAKQTSGCVIVLSGYYDLISLLVVPVSLVSLFINITIIAFMTIPNGHRFRQDSRASSARFELKSSRG